MAMRSDGEGGRPAAALGAVVPGYLHDHDSPGSLFTRLQRVVIFLEMLQEEAVADFDISFRDFVILATLRREPEPHELPVSQLAEYVLRPMGSISQAVDRVEQRGLVTRRPTAADRRKVLVALTSTGLQFANEVMASYTDVRKRIFKRLSTDDSAKIDESVHLLLDALEADHWEVDR